MNGFLSNDKNLVVISILIISLALIYSRPLSQAELAIINSAISDMLGIAVGRATVK